MTRVDDRKVTRVETEARYRDRALIVTLESHEVVIREKGRRYCYAVPWVAVYELAMKLAAREALPGRGHHHKGGA